ncbi:hypothetical protein VIGAN_11099400, partial [Vigna angularis var. angularis]
IIQTLHFFKHNNCSKGKRRIDYSIIFLDVHNNSSRDSGLCHFGHERVKLHSVVDPRVIVCCAFFSSFTFLPGWSLAKLVSC